MALAVPGFRRLQFERFVKFGLVGLLGFGLNLVVQAILTEAGGLNYVVAAILATQVSSTANFVLAELWVFSPDRREGRGNRYLAFLAMNNAALVLRVPIMWVLTSVLGVQYSVSNAVSLVVLMVVRFGLADNLIWREPTDEEAVASPMVVATPSVAAPGMAFAMAMAAAGSTTVAPTLDPDPPPGSASALPGSALGNAAERPSGPTTDEKRAAADAWTRPFRGQRWMLGVIVLAGAFLRTWQITAVGFNSDEAVYSGQAAVIAGDHDLSPFFPVIRAHPLLFQGVLSVVYRFGTSELTARLTAAAFGVATILAAYAVARLLYGPRTALIAALFVALMPYQVVVNRQVLLDGPTAFFATVTLYLLARYAVSHRSGWLIASAAAAGVTVLSKETAVVLVVAMFAFLALSPDIRIRFRDVAWSIGVFLLVLVPFPLTIVLAGKQDTGSSYLSWQLFRRPNHPATFYVTTLPRYIGPVVLMGVLVALVACVRGRSWSWREWLLVCWSMVPFVFFQLWPVKGFHYLLAASVPIAILGASGVAWLLRWSQVHTRGRWRSLAVALGWLSVLVVAASLAIPAWTSTQGSAPDNLLAGAGGVPGGRETGTWLAENSPVGAEVLTLGPSMANLVEFYGHRQAYGLSVSPNPLNRNPSYEPLRNPDLALRSSQVQYVVWDAYSAARSGYFSDRLTSYVERYHGNPVFTYAPGGSDPRIIVFEVHP